jgi:hypothetical protein
MHLWQKQHRIKLDSEEYPILRNLVLERDGWRCQECARPARAAGSSSSVMISWPSVENQLSAGNGHKELAAN